MKIFLVLLLLPIIVLGKEPVRDIAASDWGDPLDESGKWLIYNCTDKHWQCVQEEDYRDCQEKHKEDAKTNSFKHTCVPVSEFPTIRSCQQRILFLTSHNYGTNFCVKEEWSLKPIDP